MYRRHQPHLHITRKADGVTTPGLIPIRNPAVVQRPEDDDWSVLVNLDNFRSVALSPTAVSIWGIVDGRRDVSAVMEAVCRVFEATPPSARREVTIALAELAEHGFVGYEILPSAEPAAEEPLADRTRYLGSRHAQPGVLLVALTGSSMLPTLREPDVLEVASINHRSLRVGDVVYFRSPESGAMIVHRIVAVSPSGIRTRGDNCAAIDDWVLRAPDIAGRVVATRRGSRRRRVLGGVTGVGTATVGRVRTAVDRAVSPRLAGAYGRLAASSVPREAWRAFAPPRLQPRLVRFGMGVTAVDKVLLGNREVGRFDRARRDWTMRRPYRLLVDTTALPLSPSPAHHEQVPDQQLAAPDHHRPV